MCKHNEAELHAPSLIAYFTNQQIHFIIILLISLKIKLQITSIYIIEKNKNFAGQILFFLPQNNEGDAGQSKLDNAKCNFFFFFYVTCSFNMMLIHFRSDCYGSRHSVFSRVCVRPHFCCRAHHSECFNVQICVVNCWCISMFFSHRLLCRWLLLFGCYTERRL